jgi:hypothetical protein
MGFKFKATDLRYQAKKLGLNNELIQSSNFLQQQLIKSSFESRQRSAIIASAFQAAGDIFSASSLAVENLGGLQGISSMLKAPRKSQGESVSSFAGYDANRDAF